MWLANFGAVGWLGCLTWAGNGWVMGEKISENSPSPFLL
jgi:hypothetical protein